MQNKIHPHTYKYYFRLTAPHVWFHSCYSYFLLLSVAEALRVETFHKTCASSTGEDALRTLGKLMTQSHESLRHLYECSNPQLDQLISLSGELTMGARLTGAGWGGCAVALLKSTDADAYVNMLATTFYKVRGVESNLDRYIFKTAPNAGACIYTADGLMPAVM